MNKLIILFDAGCAFCRRSRRWLQEQPAFVELEFLPSDAPEITTRFRGLEPLDTPDELIVINDEGGVYRGPDAFIMCLWALENHRETALWLARPWVRPLARHAFEIVSRSRGALSRLLNGCGLLEERLGDELVALPRSSAGCSAHGPGERPGNGCAGGP